MASMVACLICVPLIFAGIIACISNDKVRGYVVYVGGVVIMGLVVATVYKYAVASSMFSKLKPITFELPYNEVFNMATIAGDVILMIVIVYLSFKWRKYWISIFSIVQTGIVLWVEFMGPEVEEKASIRFDNLTMIMILIIGFVGCLIGIYAVGYLRGYHVHHKEYKDRRRFFLSMVFVFYAAMFGLVTTQNVMWLECFWEVTSVCSFLLIGYTRTDEAITNSFRALWMNLVGGLGFAVVILIGAYKFSTFNLYDIISLNVANLKGGQGDYISLALLQSVCLAMLAFAAISKTAQFPFSKWLLGAMVAPTPSSALLHSATMVKAGVYLLIRISPYLYGTYTGKMVYMVGGFTFFAASFLAISQSDGKKVLAYSTISNLGLMVMCCGVGTESSRWAAIFLMIFHAISKSMCFQAVGAIENTTGSRDIEDMQGLMKRLPKLGLILLIGMSGMYLAPFGMLISKWAALKTVVDSSNTLLVIFICFGSASTMFYWTKWMSKILGPQEQSQKDVTEKGEYISMFCHATMALASVLGMIIISDKIVNKYIISTIVSDSVEGATAMSNSNLRMMLFMVLAVFVVPFITYLMSKGVDSKKVTGYMNGINVGDNKHFVDAFGEEKELHVSNWYLENMFGEKKLFTPSVIIGLVFICAMLCTVIGNLIGGGVI